MSVENSVLQKLNSFTKREQLLLFATGIVLIFMVMQFAWLEPLQSNRQETRIKIKQQQIQNDKLLKELDKLNLLHQGEYAQLVKTSRDLDQKIKQLRNKSDSFRTLGEWLSIILSPFEGLEIVSLENELQSNMKDESHEYVTIYHLHLQGDYSSVLEFLKQLEKVPNVLSFDDFKFAIKRFPQADIHITLSFLNSQTLLNQLELE